MGAQCPRESNLALRPGVRLTVSVLCPKGGGARDPHVLLNETAHRLDGRPLSEFAQSRTYDTYDGQNQASGPYWYVLEFPEPVAVNCVEMTMGLPYRDGGWWRSLSVEYATSAGDWREVRDLRITPPYYFQDTCIGRRPYETYALIFDEVVTRALRLIGHPGGLAQFTSLGRLAAYHRDLSRWSPADLPPPPVPYIFQLIPPRFIWDLSESFFKLSGLRVTFPLMEYYLDTACRQKIWECVAKNYYGEPDLWFLLADTVGWSQWFSLQATNTKDVIDQRREPYINISMNQTFAWAVAPIVIEGQVYATMETYPALLKIDWDWHRRYAKELNIPWDTYRAAIERSSRVTLEQLTGAAAVLGTVANTVANLLHKNLHLQRELDNARRTILKQQIERRFVVRKGIEFMEEHLDARVRVSEIARALGYSAPYFCRLFVEEINRSPRDFLIDLRIERAKEYLRHTPLSVAAVAAHLGYDVSYFTRLFKRRTGYTPRQYARRVRSGRDAPEAG